MVNRVATARSTGAMRRCRAPVIVALAAMAAVTVLTAGAAARQARPAPPTEATTIDIVAPPAGESVTEGTILEWSKQPGDAVQADGLIEAVDLVGVPEKNTAGEPLDDLIFDVVVSTIEGLPRAKKRDPDAMAESVRRAVRSALSEQWGKKALCYVHVLTI